MDEPTGSGDRPRSIGRRRNGILAALVVVVVVAAIVALQAGHNDRGSGGPAASPGAWEPPKILTIWPENSADPVGPSYEETQAQVDAGHSPWRLDPVRTATAFVHAVFGDVRVMYRGRPTTGPPGDRPVLLRLNCACPHPKRVVGVFVTQPARHGRNGIWSVVSVRSSTLGVPTPGPTMGGSARADQVLNGLGPFPISIDQRPSEHTAVGISSYDGCQTDYSGAVDLRGSQTYQLDLHGDVDKASPQPGGVPCGPVRTAYIFAYTTPQLTTQIGDPLKESAAISDLSIWPVYWTPAPR